MSTPFKTFFLYSVLVLAFMAMDLLNNGNQFNVLYILWGLSPTIAAVITAAVFYGKSGIKDLFSRIVKKFELKWLVRLILLQLITYMLGLLIYGLVEIIKPSDLSFSILTTIPAVFATAFIMNIWEEIGWRGFLLEKIMSGYSLFISSLAVGIVWGLWHIAYFLNNASQNSLQFILVAIFWMVCSSFIYSYIYVRSKRSILAVGIFHAFSNTLQSVIINSALDFAKYFYFLTIAVALMAIFFLIWQRKLFFNVVPQEPDHT
jgi:membrane protease YdiL (CAAX protease family)